jgi:hypothetical protein
MRIARENTRFSVLAMMAKEEPRQEKKETKDLLSYVTRSRHDQEIVRNLTMRYL